MDLLSDHAKHVLAAKLCMSADLTQGRQLVHSQLALILQLYCHGSGCEARAAGTATASFFSR